MCQSSVVASLGILCVLYIVEACINCMCFCWNSGAVLDRESHTVTPLKQGLLYKEHTFQWRIHRPVKWQKRLEPHNCKLQFLHLWRIDPCFFLMQGLSCETLQYYHPRLSFDLNSCGQACGFAKSRSGGHIEIKTAIWSCKIRGCVQNGTCCRYASCVTQQWPVMQHVPRRICEFASSFSALLCHRLWNRTCHYFICVVVKYCVRTRSPAMKSEN